MDIRKVGYTAQLRAVHDVLEKMLAPGEDKYDDNDIKRMLMNFDYVIQQMESDIDCEGI